MKLAIVVLVIAMLAIPAHADELSRAQKAFADLRYDEALAIADRAWRAGGNDLPTLRALFELAGEAAGSIGDDDAARLWFSRWLVVDGGELPPGTSPKLTALYADARTALGGAKISFTVIVDDAAAAITVTSDPLALVDAARAGKQRAAFDHGKAELRGCNACEHIELLDRYGNVVATNADRSEVAIHPPPPSRPPLVARWPLWAATAGGLALAGGIAMYVAVDARDTLQSLDATSSSHEFTAAQSAENRMTRAQWVARFAFGGAAAAAIASVVLWQREEHLVVAPAQGGAAVAWRASF